jgi:hypothetical protein
MRFFFLAVVIGFSATSAIAGGGNNLSMVAIGLPFDPETPEPIGATHPLYHRVEVGEIDGLPATVQSSSMNFIAAAKRSSINTALRDSFQRMSLLSENPSDARFRLSVRWMNSHTPFRIATHNTATATLHYELARIDNGRVLFDRDITTSVDGGGIDASMRDNGIVRAAIAANFASAANCLDHAAFGTAPGDCALTPKFRVSVERK